MILHCMKKDTWEEDKYKQYIGEQNLEQDGYIHCSPVEYMWRVTPNFSHIRDELVLLYIDTDKLESEVRWEDGDNCGRSYPHVYGPINTNAVITVLPYMRDKHGIWIKNDELKDILNR